MTDCFQPCEKEYNLTYETIKLLNKYGIHYLIVTKSDLVADDRYISVMDKNFAHIQITVTCTDDRLASTYEHATPPSKRIAAIEKLERLGFDVQIRLSPFIPEYLDFEIINKIRCRKAIIEFLRVNAFIKNTFPLADYSKYSHKEGGYYHLELNDKLALLRNITGFDEISICEDCAEAYEYWKNNINFNKEDCCNLRFKSADISNKDFRYIGNIDLLKETKTAFLCSGMPSDNTVRASEKWAADMAVKNRCIISGFQSKAEKAVLNIVLNENGKAIMCLANKIFKSCPDKFKKAVNENHLLIISYFDDSHIKITRENAELRNKKVLDLADKIVVGYAKQTGMTEKLVHSSKKPCFILNKTNE